MASYKTHLAVSILLGGGLAALAVTKVVAGAAFAPFIFAAAIIGGMAPDVDYDEGTPVRLLFVVISAAAAVYTFRFVSGGELVTRLGWSAGVFLAVFFVGGTVFKHMTAHRGIFHSVPMAVAVGLGVYYALARAGRSSRSWLVVSACVSIGYLAHLILDEMNSAVNLTGIPFIPKSSLGSALKFYSQPKWATVAVYGAVIVLAALCYPYLAG